MKPRKPGSGYVDWGKDEKTQPCKPYERPMNHLGDAVSNELDDFNTSGKSTNTRGSDYHDGARPDSGLHGNFAEKDATIAHLTETGKSGQQIRHWSGNERQANLKTNNVGSTAYNSRPIPEVYKPATSGQVPPADAVTYKTKTKSRKP